MTTLDRVDALLGEPVSMRSLAVVRILVGLVAAAHLWPLVHGPTHRGRFHDPYLDWYSDLPLVGSTPVLVLGFVAALATSVGVLTRLATATTFAVVAHHLLISTTHVHNNRAYLTAVLLVLALAPVGRVWSLDAWWHHRRGVPWDEEAPAWPIWLLRFECATVYLASGVSKLVDPDWFGGTVTWLRVATHEATLRAAILPGFVDDVLLDRGFHTLAAKAIVATELFIGIGLWFRRTRPWAVAVAVAFHVAIELSARVQVFSYLAVAVLFVWADPAMPWLRRDRSPSTPTALSRVSP